MALQYQGTLTPDVLVCGGGCAGIGATLGAARSGVSTLLVEWAGFAGGILTAVGLPYFDGIADIGSDRIVTRGVPLELFARMGGCEPDATHIHPHNPVVNNIEALKLLLDRMLRAEPQLSFLYHSFVCGVERDGDRIDTVIVANKAGLLAVKPKVVVDCTGDADVAAWSGAPTEKHAELQPLSLHFRVGHVKQTPEVFGRCRAAVIRAHERGELPMFYGPGVSFMFADDEVYVHGIRVAADATDPHQLTAAEVQGREDAWAMFEAWKAEVPEFADAHFIDSGPYIGVRETRRIVGQHVLTEEEITKSCRFDDAIATGCWYLDQHPNRATVGSAQDTPKVQPTPYDIPYRSLLPREVSNLLVAGRCHSATQLAASSTRVATTAMAMGEAAGVAAALAVRNKSSLPELDHVCLRATLAQRDAGPFTDHEPATVRRHVQIKRGLKPEQLA